MSTLKSSEGFVKKTNTGEYVSVNEWRFVERNHFVLQNCPVHFPMTAHDIWCHGEKSTERSFWFYLISFNWVYYYFILFHFSFPLFLPCAATFVLFISRLFPCAAVSNLLHGINKGPSYHFLSNNIQITGLQKMTMRYDFPVPG